MISPGRFSRILLILGKLAILAAVPAAAILLGAGSRRIQAIAVPEPSAASPSHSSVATSRDLPTPVVFRADDWSAFSVSPQSDARPSAGPSRRAADVLRLAGTFFVAVGEEVSIRRAVLDDLSANAEHVVGEGDEIADFRVADIRDDHVVLDVPGGEQETLWLSFRTGQSAHGSDTNAAAPAGVTEEPLNAFGGRRVGQRRWVFDRDAILRYYQTLLDDPSRLVAVFDSLKPDRNDRGKIAGYELDVRGEADFFQAIGLLPGDVVRGVNSLPMTNRKRAEYFIREFVDDRLNVFVLDVERGGATNKFIYQVR